MRRQIRDELVRVEDDEETQVEAARRTVEGFIEKRDGYAAEEAARIVDKCEAFRKTVPLTITFNAESMFDDAGLPRFGKDHIAEQMIGTGGLSRSVKAPWGLPPERGRQGFSREDRAVRCARIHGVRSASIASPIDGHAGGKT